MDVSFNNFLNAIDDNVALFQRKEVMQGGESADTISRDSADVDGD